MTDDFHIPHSWLREYVDCINSEISGLFGDRDSRLQNVMLDSLSKGKRIRAILALLWCEAISGNYRPAIPVAVAYELAHAAALVEDDIIDHSEMRRGEKSIVSKYGLPEAILASNLLLSYVPRKIAKYASDSSGEMLSRLFELLGESYGAAVWGEFLDLEMARRSDASEKDYETMIRSKTGALVAASSASGAIVGGALKQDGVVKAAYSFGELLGMAYQVQDDLLDIVGDEGTLGKPVLADIKSGKKNIVLLHTLQECSEADQRFLTGLLGRKAYYKESEIEKAKDLFARYNSIKYARDIAIHYTDEARRVLDSVEHNETHSKLLKLSEYLSERNY